MAVSSGFQSKGCRNKPKNSYLFPRRCRSGPELSNWCKHRCIWFFSLLCAGVGWLIWNVGRGIVLEGHGLTFLISGIYLDFFYVAGKLYYCHATALLISRPMVLNESLTGNMTELRRNESHRPLYLNVNTFMHLNLCTKMSGKWNFPSPI